MTRLRNRSRMRRKDVADLAERIAKAWAPTQGLFDEEAMIDEADAEGRKIWLMDNEVIAFEHDGRVSLSVRGLLKYGAGRAKVTVDMGAIRFVTNGADIMTPGITKADPDIQPEDLVWIADETHGKPLATGQALLTGPEIEQADKGKGIRNLHYLGDKLWDIGHEEEDAA